MATELFMRPDDAEVRLKHLQALNNEQNEAFTQLETALTTIMSGWSGLTPELFNSKLENVRNRTVSAGIYNELQKYVDAFGFAIQTYRTNEEAARQKVEALEERKSEAAAAIGVGTGAGLAACYSWRRGMGNPGMQLVRPIEGGRLDGLNIFRREPDVSSIHNGVDLFAPHGTVVNAGMGVDISALGEGTVIIAHQAPPDAGTYGSLVVVEFVVDGQPVRLFFGHLDSVNVAPGQGGITAETAIGAVGSSGSGSNPANPHLHIEVRVPPWLAPHELNPPTFVGYGNGRYLCPEAFFSRLGSNLPTRT